MIDNKVGEYELLITCDGETLLYCPIEGIPEIEMGSQILVDGFEYKVIQVDIDILFDPNSCTQIVIIVD